MDKQIQKMAKIILKVARECDGKLCEECEYNIRFKNKGRFFEDTSCQSIAIATKLLKHYQPKINKDKIIISKEEKQKLLKEMYEQGRFDALADLDKEGKIVITRQEYTELQEEIHFLKMQLDLEKSILIEQWLDKTREETAEKIYDKGKEIFGDYFDKTGLSEYILANFLTNNSKNSD